MFVPLGDVPDSVGISRLHHLSADGTQGYGESHFPGNQFVANEWGADRGVELVGSSLGTPANVGVNGMDGTGSRVIGTLPMAGSSSAGFLWDATTGIQFLGDLLGGDSSTPLGISQDGTVVVGMSPSSRLDSEAFVWIEGEGMVGLGAGGPLRSYQNSTAARIVSGDGSTVLGQSISANGIEIFLWTEAGGLQRIGGSDSNYALKAPVAISWDGSIIAGRDADGAPVLWSAQGVTALGTVDGHVGSAPWAMDGAGTVVVGTAATGDNCVGIEPWIWTADLGTLVLKDYLAARGAVGLEDWCLVVPSAVSFDGNVITGNGFDPEGESRGWIAYLDAPPGLNLGESICSPAVSNSSGVPASILTAGSRLVENNATTLHVNGLPTDQAGFFLNGSNSAFVPMAGGSQGNLCLGGAVGRYSRAGEVQDSGAFGAIGLTIDLTDSPGAMGPFAILAGQSYFFQAWYRDVNPAATSNFSDAVGVDFL